MKSLDLLDTAIFNQLSNLNTVIKIYNIANLSIRLKIHAASEFHNKPWFSDVEITMDINYQEKYEEIYWDKILCLIKLSNLELALVRWYDYFENLPENSKFRCPYSWPQKKRKTFNLNL